MKKLVSLLLTLSMLCGVSAQVFAEKTASRADRILALVKSRITVSSDYDAFSSDFYTDENGTEYTFLWENGGKSIEVTANESGIISGYLYTDSDEAGSQKPPVKKAPGKAL